MEQRADAGPAPSAAGVPEQLLEQWPGREQQLSYLWTHLSVRTARRPLLMYGGAAMGKTAMVRNLLQVKQHLHAYINAMETTKPKAITRSILDQLKGRVRQRVNGYAAETRCEGLDAFPPALEGLVPQTGAMACVVIDAAEQLPAALVASLLTCSSANVAWILISQQAPGVGTFQSGVREMPALDILSFDSYAASDLTKVLSPWQPKGDADPQLLGNQLQSMQRATRSCEDMQLVLRHTEAHRVRRRAAEAGNAADGQQHASDPGSCRPPLVPQHHAAAARRTPFPPGATLKCTGGLRGILARYGLRSRSAERRVRPVTMGHPTEAYTSGMENPSDLDDGTEAGLQLPRFAYMLLVAAYVASRTKEQENRQVCDPRARKRRRRGQLAHDKQIDEAHLTKLKGRHSFGLERLLALFWSLAEEHTGLASGERGHVPGGSAAQDELQSAQVLGNVASLVSMRLLSQGPGDMLRGAKYTCSVPDALARDMAQRIGLNLQQYVQ